jgi:hypothetical protein
VISAILHAYDIILTVNLSMIRTFHVDFEFFLVDLSISNNRPVFIKAQVNL